MLLKKIFRRKKESHRESVSPPFFPTMARSDGSDNRFKNITIPLPSPSLHNQTAQISPHIFPVTTAHAKPSSPCNASAVRRPPPIAHQSKRSSAVPYRQAKPAAVIASSAFATRVSAVRITVVFNSWDWRCQHPSPVICGTMEANLAFRWTKARWPIRRGSRRRPMRRCSL